MSDKPYRLTVFMHDMAGDDPVTGTAIPYRTFVSDHASPKAAKAKAMENKRNMGEFYSHAEINNPVSP